MMKTMFGFFSCATVESDVAKTTIAMTSATARVLGVMRFITDLLSVLTSTWHLHLSNTLIHARF
jgi:hypothetical protein